MVKLIVYTPKDAEELILRTLASAGVGSSGNYSCWSISMDVTERFQPNQAAQPHQGQAGEISKLANRRLEFQVPESKYLQLIELVRSVHPYETPAIEVVPLLYPKS